MHGRLARAGQAGALEERRDLRPRERSVLQRPCHLPHRAVGRRLVEAELREPPPRRRRPARGEQLAHPRHVLRRHEVQRPAHEPGAHEAVEAPRVLGPRAQGERERTEVLRLHRTEAADEIDRPEPLGPVQQLTPARRTAGTSGGHYDSRSAPVTGRLRHPDQKR